jgi:hypothetical protein
LTPSGRASTVPPMVTTILLTAITLLQQPQSQQQQRARQAAFNSSKAAVAGVAGRVAEVKSALDVYRRAVFNGTDAEVLANSEYLRRSCLDVDLAAVQAARRICRGCAAADVDAGFDGYRAGLPALRGMSGRCAARLGQLARGQNAAKRLRAEVRAIGNPIVLELRDYERRLDRLMQSLNANPPAPAARPVRRPGSP